MQVKQSLSSWHIFTEFLGLRVSGRKTEGFLVHCEVLSGQERGRTNKLVPLFGQLETIKVKIVNNQPGCTGQGCLLSLSQNFPRQALGPN